MINVTLGSENCKKLINGFVMSSLIMMYLVERKSSRVNERAEVSIQKR